MKIGKTIFRNFQHRGQEINITQEVSGKVISLVEGETILYGTLASKRHSQILVERITDLLN